MCLFIGCFLCLYGVMVLGDVLFVAFGLICFVWFAVSGLFVCFVFGLGGVAFGFA